MRLLLDTHIVIWFASAREQLSHRERDVLTADRAELLVSTISLWEIRAKMRAERRRGKQVLTLDPTGTIAFCAAARIVLDPVTIEDLEAAPLEQDPEHGDMFDEMLLVHAHRLGAKLLTRDRLLRNHPLALQL